MRNLALARIFSEIADMLEIKEESIFRISAYRRGAARAMESVTEDVTEVAARDDLEEVPGIGTSTAEKIEEYLETGKITDYEELRASLPPGITTLMSVPEVGPKTAVLLYEKLGVTTIDELEKAARQGLVRKLPRERGVRRGRKINEYGSFRVKDEKRVAGRTEEEVYAALDLPWIPPEIREGQGEVELAEKGRPPRLVELQDIRGDLQMHTRWSDGSDSAEEMARAAKERGYEYIAITDHSQSLKFVGGVTIEELRDHAKLVKQVADKVGIAILMGTECEVHPDGALDYPDEVLKELDIVLAAVHTRFRMSEAEMTKRMIKAMENPHVDVVAHPTGRLLGQRESYSVNGERLGGAGRRTGAGPE